MTLPTEGQMWVSYLRVSSDKQGAEGLGIEAQRKTVSQFLARKSDAVLLQEFVEVESGRNNDRPKLQEAMNRAVSTGATLLIAKLDRLSRSAHFLTGLAEQKVKFIACDMPDASEFTVTLMAALAQQERKMISDRTREALQAVKARGYTKSGKPIGNSTWANHLHQDSTKAAATVARARASSLKANGSAARLKGELAAIRNEGHHTLTAIASELERRFIKTPRGNGKWRPETVRRLLGRLEMGI